MIHKLTTAETTYTATGAKLAAHWPVFEKLRDTGHASIVRATMTLHQVCSARCSYCSTSKRNKKDSITLDEAKAFVRTLYFDQEEHNAKLFPEYDAKYRELRGHGIRLGGLILSGGGQPNLWPHFAEFVHWLKAACPDLKLGLITNAFPERNPRISSFTYSRFAWIRISVTPPEASNYPDGDFARQYIPQTIIDRHRSQTVGYSYVVGPWTRDEDLLRLEHAAQAKGFAYARVLVDCNLPRSAQLKAHAELGARLLRLGLVREDGSPTGKVFHQLKVHGTPDEAASLWDEGQCFVQSYSTFWDTTGHEENGKSWCFPCDSVTVLAEEDAPDFARTQELIADGKRPLALFGKASARRFEPKWGTVTNDLVAELYEKPLRAFFDPREQCSACLFMRNNQVVKALRDGERGAFATNVLDLKHVEFP